MPTVNPPKRATLRDVAARADVSTAVVSYVINQGPRPTSPEVRERVLKAIDELNYHPNGFARGLRARRTHTIGFISHDCSNQESFSSQYVASMIGVLAAELQVRDYYLLLFHVAIGDDLAPLASLLRGGRLDGVFVRLIQDSEHADALVSLVREAEIPCVCIERPAASRFALTSVTYDDFGGAKQATNYLHERGHSRIAHLQGDIRYATALARRAGYKEALREAGLPVDPDLIRIANWDMRAAAEEMESLLTLPDPPTAVFAASDEMALGALDRLRAMGVRVPDEFAVVGFDGIPLAQDLTPALTTIRVPFGEIGRRAAELLLSGAESPSAPIVLPVELIESRSA
jgi:DNA-binding LacI/PurR family transcriptional regulator